MTEARKILEDFLKDPVIRCYKATDKEIDENAIRRVAETLFHLDTFIVIDKAKAEKMKGADFSAVLDKVNSLGFEWVRPKGTYAGSFPKRLSSMMYKEYGLVIPPVTLGQIGSQLAQTAINPSSYYFQSWDLKVKGIDWDDGQFGDGGSCYWGCNRGIQKALEDSGSFYALRWYVNSKPSINDYGNFTFDEANNKIDLRGYARSWMYYVPNMIGDQPALILFNGYGLETLRQARILSTYLGIPYTNISISPDNDLLYLNGGRTWAITPIMDTVLSKTLYVNEYLDSCDNDEEYDYVTCHCCGGEIPEDDAHYMDHLDRWLCPTCFTEEYVYVESQDAHYPVDECIYFNYDKEHHLADDCVYDDKLQLYIPTKYVEATRKKTDGTQSCTFVSEIIKYLEKGEELSNED